MSRRAFGLDVTQTPPDLSEEASKEECSRIDFYRGQIHDLRERFSEACMSISHWVGDGYYAKTSGGIATGFRRAALDIGVIRVDSAVQTALKKLLYGRTKA